MDIIKETEIRIQVLKDALAVAERYTDRDFIIAVLKGKIEGSENFLKDIEEINEKRNIL